MHAKDLVINFSPFSGVFTFLGKISGKGNDCCKRSFNNNQILGITKGDKFSQG